MIVTDQSHKNHIVAGVAVVSLRVSLILTCFEIDENRMSSTKYRRSECDFLNFQTIFMLQCPIVRFE